MTKMKQNVFCSKSAYRESDKVQTISLPLSRPPLTEQILRFKVQSIDFLHSVPRETPSLS